MFGFDDAVIAILVVSSVSNLVIEIFGEVAIEYLVSFGRAIWTEPGTSEIPACLPTTWNELFDLNPVLTADLGRWLSDAWSAGAASLIA